MKLMRKKEENFKKEVRLMSEKNNKYVEFKDKQNFEFNNFLNKNRVDVNKYNNKDIVNIGYGLYILKINLDKYINLIIGQQKELIDKLYCDDEFLFEMIIYELQWLDYNDTWTNKETFNVLGLNENIMNIDKYNKIFIKAKNNYLKNEECIE